jgi:hypothetical protein
MMLNKRKMFKVKDEFETYEEFNDKLDKWARENYFMVRKENSHKIQDPALVSTIVYQRLTLTCIHAHSLSAPKGTGNRKNKLKLQGKYCDFKLRLSFFFFLYSINSTTGDAV